MTKTPLTIITIDSDTAEGWNSDDPRSRSHEMTLPTAAMRDCVDRCRPFYSRSAANVVCLPCREASTAVFEAAN